MPKYWSGICPTCPTGSAGPNKAMGSDDFLPIILKHSTAALVELIHHLLSLCFSHWGVPIANTAAGDRDQLLPTIAPSLCFVLFPRC